MQSRREWFKSSIGFGGLMMTPSILTAEEIKKYNPPIHCVEDLHKIILWFKCFMFSNTVKPVEVKPDIASK